MVAVLDGSLLGDDPKQVQGHVDGPSLLPSVVGMCALWLPFVAGPELALVTGREFDRVYIPCRLYKQGGLQCACGMF